MDEPITYNHRMSVRIDESLWRKLKRRSADTHINMGELLDTAIREYLKHPRKTK